MGARLRSLAVGLSLVAAILFPSSRALAAPAAWDSMDLTLSHEGAESFLIVGGELRASTPLPADVELAVPAGSEIQWVGEVLGMDPSADIAVKTKKRTEKGMDIYSFKLTKSRTAQIEAVWKKAPKRKGNTFRTGYTWTPAQSLPFVRTSIRLPQAAKVTEPVEGAKTYPGETGYILYSKEFKNIRAGRELEMNVGYTLPGVGEDPAEEARRIGNLIIIGLLGLIAVIAMSVVAFAVRRRAMVAHDEGSYSDAEDLDESPTNAQE